MSLISYESWKEVCESILGTSANSLKMYIQKYPFSIMMKKEKENLKSLEYYEKNIKYNQWVIEKSNLDLCNHYYTRNDGSFRNMVLVSPIVFLFIESYGLEIYKCTEKYLYKKDVFYAGDYEENESTYKGAYDRFVTRLNMKSQGYKFYIKLDIKNFYDSIMMEYLFQVIESDHDIAFSIRDNKNIQFTRKLLTMIGKGRYPTIENSRGLSYIASTIYLYSFEEEFKEYLEEYSDIVEFEIIRYVDDTYILLNIEDESSINKIFLDIQSKYNFILNKKQMTLNSTKSSYNFTFNLSYDLKQSFYDDEVNDIKFNIREEYDLSILSFLNEFEARDYEVSFNEYKNIANKIYNIEGILLQSDEILTTLSMQPIGEYKDEVITILKKIILSENKLLRLAPKLFTRIILNTYDGQLIKILLRYLFELSRNSQWTAYEMCSVLQYLSMRTFKHTDLKSIIKKEDENLYKYYLNYCSSSDWINSVNNVIGAEKFYEDEMIFYLFGMYVISENLGETLEMYAYYKNYFDRMSAGLSFEYELDQKDLDLKRPNYRKFFTEKVLKKLYKGIDDSNLIIEEAHKVRNSNPLAHSSSELINNNQMKQKVEKTIASLEYLLESKMHDLRKNDKRARFIVE